MTVDTTEKGRLPATQSIRDSRPTHTQVPPNRWLGRLLLASVLVTAGVAFTACGKSEALTILNTEKVERAIERSSLVQRGKRAAVSCPSGVHQKKGSEFACTAVVKGKSTRFVVTQVDGSGNVHYEAR